MLALKFAMFMTVLIIIVGAICVGVLAVFEKIDSLTYKRGFRGMFVTWTKALSRLWRNQMRKFLTLLSALFFAGALAAQPVPFADAAGGVAFYRWTTAPDGSFAVCVPIPSDVNISSGSTCKLHSDDSTPTGYYRFLTSLVPKGRSITQVQIVPVGDKYKGSYLIVYWK